MNDSFNASATKILRWIGYGLLIFSAFNLMEALIPPSFLDPVWELQTIGALVEQVPLFLVGLGLVFWAKREYPTRLELFLLKSLSWLTLIVGIFYLLFIPLGMINTVRIDQRTNRELAAQFNQRLEVVQQVRTALEQVKSIEEMQGLLSRLTAIGAAPEISNTDQLQTMKDKVNAFLAQGEDRLRTQVQATRSSQRWSLLRRSLKWNLGALVSAVLLIGIWRQTREIRQWRLEE